MSKLKKIRDNVLYTIAGISLLALTHTTYLDCLSTANFVSNSNSTRIYNTSQARDFIEKERKKIDPENHCEIGALFWRWYNEANSYKKGDKRYLIEIGGIFTTEAVIKHELYHILDGHLDDNKIRSKLLSKFMYYYYYEPQATLYQTTGIKL